MIIWGNRKSRAGVGYIVRDCYRCGTTVHVVAEQKSKFTLYFIPLFTYSRTAFLFCSSCDAETELRGDDAQRVLAGVMSRYEIESAINRIAASSVATRESEVRAIAAKASLSPKSRAKSKSGAIKKSPTKTKVSRPVPRKPKKVTGKRTTASTTKVKKTTTPKRTSVRKKKK